MTDYKALQEANKKLREENKKLKVKDKHLTEALESAERLNHTNFHQFDKVIEENERIRGIYNEGLENCRRCAESMEEMFAEIKTLKKKLIDEEEYKDRLKQAGHYWRCLAVNAEAMEETEYDILYCDDWVEKDKKRRKGLVDEYIDNCLRGDGFPQDPSERTHNYDKWWSMCEDSDEEEGDEEWMDEVKTYLYEEFGLE